MKIGQLCCLLGGLWLATCGPQALAQAPPKGKVLEGRTLKSAILGREVRYTLYLPPDYDLNERRYPVTYLLHGYTDDDTGWLQFGEVNRLADAAIASGDIPPMIIAMPRPNTKIFLSKSSCPTSTPPTAPGPSASSGRWPA
jgi:enterochelin esterase-like enzyme